MKLLIADDEQYMRVSLAEEIDWAKHGIQLVGVASDGLETFNMSKRLQPDVLLADIRMPHMTGLEVMKALKHDLPRLKVILLSGWSDFEYARTAVRLGASDYLVKPCPDDEVIDAMQAVMEELGFRKGAATASRPYDEANMHFKEKRHAIKLACEFIHHDLGKVVTLSEAAEKVSMNPSAFSRLFRQEMGHSFSEFVTSARINLAKKQLLETNLKINHISQNAGYASVSHFVQVFGEVTGMTPGKFREMYG